MSGDPSAITEPALGPAPQADRSLLALHDLRQRQLRSAFLHGRRRSWRDRRRIWPAVVAAIVIVALLVTVASVLAAFQRQQELSSAPVVGAGPMIVIRSPPTSSRTDPAGR